MYRILRTVVLTALLFPAIAHAQKIKEVTIKKGKESVPAFCLKIKESKAVTQKVLKQEQQEAGLKKGKHKKGFTVHKGVVWPYISSTKMDYWYKVKGNRRKSTVYFVVSKGYDNYVSGSNDFNTASSVNTFLSRLEEQVENQKDIDDKQAELDKIDKKKAKKEKQLEKLKDKQQ